MRLPVAGIARRHGSQDEHQSQRWRLWSHATTNGCRRRREQEKLVRYANISLDTLTPPFEPFFLRGNLCIKHLKRNYKSLHRKRKKHKRGLWRGLEAVGDVIRSHSKSLVEVKGFLAADRNLATLFFRSVFSSTRVRNLDPPPTTNQKGPTMTNNASRVLVAAFLLFL